MRPFTGAWGGALLTLALSIAYDTSANVSALEGSHSHLQFNAILAFAAIGGFVGFFFGAIGWAAENRREAARRMNEQSQAPS